MNLSIHISCSSNSENQIPLKIEHLIEHLDSNQIKVILACFQVNQGYTLIVKNKKPPYGAIKITFVSGFPNLKDTLAKSGEQQYTSVRNNTIYDIRKNEVIETSYQKIIHPSSNWQGQAPWSETIVNKYQRLDRKIK